MRITNLPSPSSSGSNDAASTPAPTPLPEPMNLARGSADVFESTPKPKNKLDLSGVSAGPEPKLVKVEGQTPTYQTVSGSLVDGGVSPNDIDQGELGDCYFLSSVASLAQQDPAAIQKMLKDNGDGTYTATFYKKSGSKMQPVQVTIDGKIPELEDSAGQEEPVYAASPDSKEEWPALLEKAYAKFRSGYTTLDQGGFETDAMTALTGKPSASYDVSPSNASALYATLQKAVASGKLTTAGTFTDADLRTNLQQLSAKGQTTFDPKTTTYAKLDLVDGHAYTILGVSTENGQPMVQMRNPWGTDGFQGQGQSNGDFEIPMSQFAQLFEEVSVGG